ncbi:MAG: hypothetical protein QOH74_959 [Gaiellales bacterium]|nr:hypothetical protein [Gaiellales bacterium]
MTDRNMVYPELEFVVEVRSGPGERTRRYTGLSRSSAEVLAMSLVRYGFEARVMQSEAAEPPAAGLHGRANAA